MVKRPLSMCLLQRHQKVKVKVGDSDRGGAEGGGGVVLQEVAWSSRDAAELLITLMDKLTGASLGENEQPGHLRFPMRLLPPRHQGHTAR